MALTATEEARRELDSLRKRIEDCRRELGIEGGTAVHISAKRGVDAAPRASRGLRRRRRKARVA